MFYYFGAKHANAHKYQPPKHDLIVEPFAGAAGYACYWLERDPTKSALLIDSDKRVTETWQRILSQTPEQITRWEAPIQGQQSNDLCVVGISGGGVLGNHNDNTVTSRMVARFSPMKRRVARMVAVFGDRVEARLGNYTDAPDVEASWFVDPPYQKQGHWYAENYVDYTALGSWVRSRRGQTIVCEASPADWLPFQPLYTPNVAASETSIELIWESEPAPSLFD